MSFQLLFIIWAFSLHIWNATVSFHQPQAYRVSPWQCDI